MGLSLEFYLGNEEAISEAIRSLDLDALDQPDIVEHKADFSLHITPNDLNLLSQQIAAITNSKPRNLRPYLTPVIDENDHGLLLVNAAWVAYVAQVPVGRSAELTEMWMAAMRQEYQDNSVTITDEAIEAVQQLVVMCTAAHQSGRSIFHIWFM
jgi:hypothetical protein